MNFFRYIRDRIGYILIYFISNALSIAVMQLDRLKAGQQLDSGNILYSFILAFFIILLFIVVDYIRKKGVYRILNSIRKGTDSLRDIFTAGPVTNREHEIFLKILSKNYKTYEDKLCLYKDRQKEQLYFINQWAHQMKTPVSVINLILEDNQDGLDRNQVESMKEEVEKLSRGLEMALYTARVNDFEQDFKIENVDIASIVRGVINEHKKEFIRYSIYPRIEAGTDMKVETDAKWIKFVINQVMVNSIKYSRYKEGDNKAILAETREKDGSLSLSIRDEGVGIPLEDIKRVFQPFFTGSNGRRYAESTGMGMYLSKVVCTKLGHDIYIESQEGEWTKVTIVFNKGRSLYDMGNMTNL